MRLAVHGEAIAFQPLDQVHLPQRAMQIELVAVQARDQDPQLALAARVRQSRVAHVVVEVDVAHLAHQRQAHGEQRRLDEFQVPRRRDRVRLAHVLDELLEVVRRGVVGQGEFEQPAHVHGGVARLERKPSGIDWRNLAHRLPAADYARSGARASACRTLPANPSARFALTRAGCGAEARRQRAYARCGAGRTYEDAAGPQDDCGGACAAGPGGRVRSAA